MIFDDVLGVESGVGPKGLLFLLCKFSVFFCYLLGIRFFFGPGQWPFFSFDDPPSCLSTSSFCRDFDNV